MTACLHQARAIDHRRLASRLGQLDGDDFENVLSWFRKLYYVIIPAIAGGAAANPECVYMKSVYCQPGT
jgi:hypothetical protein